MAKGMQWDVKSANLLDKRILRYFFEKLGAMNIDNPLIYDDATFKGSVIIEGGLDLVEAKDFVVAGDQTVKGDLRIDGAIFGTMSADQLISQAQDFKVHKDLIVQDDATVKQDIYVDDVRVGGMGVTQGITTDITACGLKYRVVNGLIVSVEQKAWA